MVLNRLFEGFEGDRPAGLRAIRFSSSSADMRAPFADMVLLWYATIAAPLFGLNESEVRVGDDEVKAAVERNLAKHPRSAIFFIFDGKYHRNAKLTRDLASALRSYERAADYAAHIPELRYAALFECSWIRLMTLDYAKASEHYTLVAKHSKWSRCFNLYALALIVAALGHGDLAAQYVRDGLSIVAEQSSKLNPIESFAAKRLDYFKRNAALAGARDLCEMLCVELLYVLACVPFCDGVHLRKMLKSTRGAHRRVGFLD